MPRMYCRGGCGRQIDPGIHTFGICPDCEAREYRKNAEEWRE